MNFEALLSEQRWLSRLSRSLVRDAADAEDLAQATWMRALESGTSVQRSSRGWLARVALRERNHGVRRERARKVREERSARQEASSSTLDAVERIGTQRELARLVLELPEAQRDVLVLRFWEDLPPRRIAKRLDLSLEAVKSRLRRGLATLRERLDVEYGGDRSSWLSALVPLTQVPPGLGSESSIGALVRRSSDFMERATEAAPQILGTALVSTAAIKLFVSAVIVAGVVYVAIRPPGENQALDARAASPVSSPPQASAELAGIEADAPGRGELEGEVDRRAAMEGGDATGAAPVTTELQPLRGRLVDLRGVPLSDLAVADLQEGRESTEVVTDALGEFLLPGAPGLRAGVVTEGWTTVLAAQAPPTRVDAVAISVAAPSIALAGRVVDSWGAPVEGARIEVDLPTIRDGRVPVDLDHSLPVHWTTVSDASGAFRIDTVPVSHEAVLSVRAEELPAYSGPAPTVDREDLWIVLSEPEDGDGRLVGLVVDDAGAPIPGATVSFGVEVTAADEAGRFVLALDDEEGMNRGAARFMGDPIVPREIRAFAPGHQAGSYEVPLDAEGQPVWPESVVVELGGAPLSLSGRVVDEDGVGVPGAMVWLVDSTVMGMGPRTVVLESELGGYEEGGPQTVTDEEGRFEMNGLQDRAYTLTAVDERTLLRAGPVTVEAGATDVLLRLPADLTWPFLRGRVVDRQGNPVPDVLVRLMTDTLQLRYQGQVFRTSHSSRDDSVVTGPAGTFELDTVPRRSVYLRLDGPDIVPLGWGRSQFALEKMLEDPDRVEIVVGIRRRFRVELADPTRADGVSVLDQNGEMLQLSLMMGNGRRDGDQLPIEEGSTGVLTVGDSAATLVLYSEGQEIQRLPIELDGDEVRLFEL